MQSLNVYSLTLILNEGSFSCVKASQTLGFVSHDSLTRNLSQIWQYSAITDWNTLPKQGTLVIDDTVIAKPYGPTIEHVAWTYSSLEKGIIQGISSVLIPVALVGSG